MDKKADDVGTGLVGAPACGDVMKLQIKVRDGRDGERERERPGRAATRPQRLAPKRRQSAKVSRAEFGESSASIVLDALTPRLDPSATSFPSRNLTRMCPRRLFPFQVDANGVITESKFKTFGCGSAIASSSLVTEWVQGKTVDEVQEAAWI
jgi:hypothetical protein